MTNDKLLETIGVYALYISFSVICASLALIKLWPYSIIIGVIIGVLFAVNDSKSDKEVRK